MAQYSVRVATLLSNIQHVRVAAHTHASSILPKAASLLGLSSVHMETHWQAHIAFLEEAARSLEQAEEAYIREQADDQPHRDARDAQAVEVANTLRTVANTLEAAFGPEVAAHYKLNGPMPDVPSDLLRRAEASLSMLRTSPRTARHKFFGIEVSTEPLADQVASNAGLLRTALEAVKQEEHELKATLYARDQAMAAAGRAYRVFAATLQTYCLLAGEDWLAERVRPTRRRSSGVDSSEPPSPAPEPADS